VLQIYLCYVHNPHSAQQCHSLSLFLIYVVSLSNDDMALRCVTFIVALLISVEETERMGLSNPSTTILFVVVFVH
jgi:hypothetical protein